MSRIPVCAACLSAPQPLAAEYCCVSCHTPFLNAYPLNENGLCRLCQAGITGFDSVYSFGSYEGTLRKLIQLYKYGRIRTLARPLGRYLRSALPDDARFDLIVPVPLHWRKRWRRGFNQSDLLARDVARRTGLPVSRAVRRVKPAPPQAGLSNAQRRANVAGAFAVRRPVAGLRVLLIDDVMTTGATASACARALKRARAARVTLLTLARVDRRLQASGRFASLPELSTLPQGSCAT